MKVHPSKNEKIGPYQIIKPIAQGGMGEVWLGFDPLCRREVAIKIIRRDVKNHEFLRKRFLKEALFTSSLTHPGVITIYSISEENDTPYYTMPYIEGKTLKQIIKDAIANIIEGSIPTFLPYFKLICQTIAYAHSKGVIHRDLKPENILIGKFGEVVILDWGLAVSDHEKEYEADKEELEALEKIVKDDLASIHLTKPGKIVGTLAYLAPERTQGVAASALTDIYALGVILYQLLTLHLPFHRLSLADFQKKFKYEKYLEPQEIAPYRDVPLRLSSIVKKCLAIKPEERYQSVEGLIHDLMSYMEGRAEWYEVSSLDVNKKEDWEFQENVFVARHMAITRSFENAEWVSIMLSKTSFAENLKLDCDITIGAQGDGVGILFSVPEGAERQEPIEGYCLWLGSDRNPSSQLFRNTASVMLLPELVLQRGETYHISLEKRDHNIFCHINGSNRFTYISYLPLVGTHVGLISRDADFKISPLQVFISSHTLQVSCLAIPDAFLASKDYKRALAEYRRIGYSFPGHAEGREALFRAGITLLEQGRNSLIADDSKSFFDLALQEFARLHKTPGAPLEYLGKSLVYQASNDSESEIKCLEIALRRFPNHPLISAIKEQILYRLHETAKKSRPSAYRIILTALRQLPEVVETKEFQSLFENLINYWEVLPFFEDPIPLFSFNKITDKTEKAFLLKSAAIALSFWLGEPFYLLEIFQELDPEEENAASYFGNIIYALFELGVSHQAIRLFQILEKKKRSSELTEVLTFLRPIVLAVENGLEVGFRAFFALKLPDFGLREFRTLRFLLDRALWDDSDELIERAWKETCKCPFSLQDKIEFDAYRIAAFLMEEKWDKASDIFAAYSLEMLNQESTVLHPLFGCFLRATEEEEIALIHFAGVIEIPFPRSWALLSHEINGKLKEPPSWYEQSFLWERRQLYRQLTIYYHSAEDPEKETFYRQEEQKEYLQENENL